MKTQIDQTVAGIAVQYPSTIPLFEGFKIDYCCGGNKSLQEACAKAGAPLEEVSRSLERIMGSSAPGEALDWSKKKISELVGFLLEKHHRYTRQQLALLDRLSEKVARVHGQTTPNLLRSARSLRKWPPNWNST